MCAYPAPSGFDMSFANAANLELSSNSFSGTFDAGAPPQSPSNASLSPSVNNSNSNNNSNNSFSMKTFYIPEDPLQVVRVQAIKDGDQAKRRASNILTNLEDPIGSRAELQVASACFKWAGVSDIDRGVTAVEEDIFLFETRKSAEKSCEASFHKYKEMKYDESLQMMMLAHGQYEQAGDLKRSSEFSDVVTMIKIAQSLLVLEVFAKECFHQSESLKATSTPQALYDVFECKPKKALLIAQSAKPTFLSMASVRSSGLRKWSSSATQSVDQLQHATSFLQSLASFQSHLLDKSKLDKAQFAELIYNDMEQLVKIADSCRAMERPGVIWSLPLTLQGIESMVNAVRNVVGLFRSDIPIQNVSSNMVSAPSSSSSSSSSSTSTDGLTKEDAEADIPEEIPNK
jgi:hypothetical protein